MVLLCWIALLALSSTLLETRGTESAASVDVLQAIRSDISANVSAFCYMGPSGTKNAFLAGTYKPFVRDLNVLVYPFCLETRELGNRLGNYLHEVTCADAAGMHFVAVHPQWDITGSINSNQTKHNDLQSRLAFLKALPEVIVHESPASRGEAADKLNKACKCNRYCWQQRDAPWVTRTHLIRRYLQGAARAYLSVVGESTGTLVDPEHDLTNAAPGSFLPIIPEVAIQYRCGDNLGFSYRYGILPFTAFLGRIPANAKLIYVLSDHPSRAQHNPNVARCKQILDRLFDFLKEHYPSATLVIKRGGDLFLDYVRLSLAKTTICSVSSYCFWPAITNEHTAYFPLTSLIAGADSLESAPSFGPHFHWMNESYISNFKGLRPWTQIFDVLTGNMPIP